VHAHHTLCALAPASRVLCALLRACSRLGAIALLVALASVNDPPITVYTLAPTFLVAVLLPELYARLGLRAFEGTAGVRDGRLAVERPGLRAEVPVASIARIEPWRVPWPLPGVTLVLASGARFPLRLALRDPEPLLARLAAEGVEAARAAIASPVIRYAAARARWPRRFFDSPWCKVVLFSLLPAGIGFNAHQHIAFGAFLGEYYLMGPVAWLRSAAEYWTLALVYLALWSGLFRAAVEGFARIAAQLAPEKAGGARRIAERAATPLYYLSVPALLAVRFLV
jgi:apolipoprotein N-acyltransferase